MSTLRDMSILSFLKRLSSGRLTPEQKRAAQAADEMWAAVSRGIKFEVPAADSLHDSTMQAVALLTRAHPEVEVAMHQSRGLIIGLMKDKHTKVSNAAWGVLGSHGYFPEVPEGKVEALLTGHERFMRANQLEPAEMVKQAQEAQQAKEAITVGAAPAPTVETVPAPTVDATLDGEAS